MTHKEYRLTFFDNMNYFFGFHDLKASNNDGSRIAALRIEDIHTPPRLESPCEVGYLEKGEFIKLGQTSAYNYPQGSRQQWVGDTNLLIVNDKVGDVWGSKLYNTDNLALIDTIAYPCHVITDKGWAFGIDYARLHRVGGYGYTGLLEINKNNNAPENSGIIKHNIYTKEVELILSIKQVANFNAKQRTGKHHYITHLVLNPSQTRIAFLHRCKLNDGGETTRLMTIGINGEELRCLATGFLSHFDWKDDAKIAIWGRTGSGIEKLRNNPIIRMIPPGLMRGIKKIIKDVLKKKKSTENANVKKPSSFDWLLLSDSDSEDKSLLGEEVLEQDGHPMFCPSNRDWMVSDTYPNEDGIRELYLFQYSTQKKITLGTYQMIFDKPNLEKVKPTLEDVEKSVLSSFSLAKMAFYRSGLHCDLHPRWNADGTSVIFDSIHEGTRQMYAFDVSKYMN